MGQKKKKEKIVYYDDGRTVADMSNVQAGPRLGSGSWRPKHERKAIRQTYFNAVKRMFVPMLAVICAICIIYMIIYAVFLFMY